MKKYLAPSILGADFTKLGEQLGQIEHAGAHMVHIDVMDGMFVPSISMGMPVIASIRKASGLIFDVHMMVQDPERYISVMKESGADILSIHVEACKDPAGVLQAISDLGMEPAIAISPKTPLDSLRPYLHLVREVLLMSVEPGFGGQAILPDSFERLEVLSAMRTELGLDFTIEVDGGIKLDNVEKVLEKGADVIVAGSAVFRDDVEHNVKDFLHKLSKYEV